jgi:NAD(P)-dependent dehydrogenase (short-subunit alcohol dehydrogenase family)
VVLVDRESDHFSTLSDKINATGAETLAVSTDITQEDQVTAMVAKTIERFGQIDILVNNAGIVHRVPAVETTLEHWQQTMNVNLTGTFLCGREVGKAMIPKQNGKIVNIASINSAVARPNLSAYGASKAGVMQLTRCWALEWAPFHVNVNGVAPSFVETEMTTALFQDEQVRKQLLANLPLGRIGTVRDVAGAVLFLASEAASYITGHTLFVDGGWTVQ